MTKAINTEDMIIDLFRNPRNKHLIGDDATTIYQDKTSITISQDTLNAGVHFDLSFCSPEVVAQRCFCANISDMAAMGLTGHYLMQSLSIPKSLTNEWIKRYAQTLNQLCIDHGIILCGGDTCRHDLLSITMTVLHIGHDIKPLTRFGAQTGDHIFISGPIGQSQLGLLALQQHIPIATNLLNAFLNPQPQTQLAKTLLASGRVHACMDLTDGLVTDLGRLCALNKLNADVFVEQIPEDPSYRKACEQLKVDAWLNKVSGGEDYALVIIGPSDLPKQLSMPIYPIGIMTDNTDNPSIDWYDKGKRVDMKASGFSHFDD